jgi:membrane protease YdiL (CAAX protease family)
LRWIALAAASAILLACLISPMAYWMVQSLSGLPFLAGIAEFPFHRYFSRTAQICMLVCLVPLAFKLRIFRWENLGLQTNRQWSLDLGTAFLAALLPAVVLTVFYISQDIFRPRKDLPFTPLLRIVMTAGVVATLEEFLFRGVFLGLAIRSMGALKGSILVSLVFAFVHFLKPGKAAVDEVTWASGFGQVAAIFSNLPPPAILGFGFLSLLAAGLLLAWVTLRTRSLWAAIGLHAGWILGQQGLNWFAKFRAKPPEEFLPWVGPNVVSGVVPTGILPLLALVITGILIGLYFKYAGRTLVSKAP